jgi:hypothetical protein
VLSFTHPAIGTERFHLKGDQLKGEKKTVSRSLIDFFSLVLFLWGVFIKKSKTVLSCTIPVELRTRELVWS